MFRSAKWRSEKKKIRAVFKLWFYVSQASQLNADGLILSVVPGDVAKPTVKLEKAVVRDGCCRWNNPVYETVKFVQDPKTGKINQRIYHFILSTTGSSNTVGEASIDFSDYADVVKASSASLPLQNSNFKAVLHVSIQRQVENIDQQRGVEVNEDMELCYQDHSLKSFLSNGKADENIKNDPQQDRLSNRTTQNVELRRRASIGSDSTLSSSESISELDTPQEVGNRGNITHQHHLDFIKSLKRPSMLLPPVENVFEEPHISESDWLGTSEHGISTDDSTNSSHEPLAKEISQIASISEAEKLKAELLVMTRQLDLSELELQSLRKQIVKETKRGQDLLRDVAGMKEQRDSFQAECEKLQAAFDNQIDDSKLRSKLQFEDGDPWVRLEEIKQELNYEKDLNSNLRLQLQKTQESNTELILAVQDLEVIVDQKNREADDTPVQQKFCQNNELRRSSCISETDEDEDQKALEELVRDHKDAKEAYLLEQKISDLYNEIDIYRRDRDELEIQMEQLALDYEILRQENHDLSYKLEQSQLQEQLKTQYECSSSLVNVNELENQVESLESELKKQSEEHSESLTTIKELENQIKDLEEENEKKTQIFEADIEAVTRDKVEQEQRAIRAEEALRKTRWKNASVAEKLQDEFRRLSEQMASTFNANEKMAMKSMTEANELRMQKRQLEEMLMNTKNGLETVKEEYEMKLHQLSELVKLKSKELEEMSKDLLAKCDHLEHEKKQQEDARGNLSREIVSLKYEIERLTTDKQILTGQAEEAETLRVELEEMKKSIKVAGMVVERGNLETNNLQRTIETMKKESERFLMELYEMSRIRDEKENTVVLLQSELETIKVQTNNLKYSLAEDEKEKDNLRKQVAQVKTDLERTEDALFAAEKKLKDYNGRGAVGSGTKAGLRNNKAGPVAHASKEVSGMKEKIKLLEGQIKVKENALEAAANTFLEKEKDLKHKIEELESRMEELDQSGAALCEYQFQDGLKDKNTWSEESLVSTKSDDRFDDGVTELATLREKNTSMESELKEMQERYSEISLKFAEVEGERQQLVMTVRNLKNSKKS